MESIDFVGRGEEVGQFEEWLDEVEDRGIFSAVVAPAGYGKTALVREFLDRSGRRSDTYTFYFTFNESSGTEQFVEGFQDQWQDQFQASFTKKISESLSQRVVNRGLKFSLDAIGAGSAIFPPLAAAPLAKYALPSAEGEDQRMDLTPEVLLELFEEFSQERPDARLVLVFDQYDRLAESQREEFGRLFRDLARDLPTNILCCVASRGRFYNTSDDINEISLSEFSVQETEEFLAEADVDILPEQVSGVYGATNGHPYSLERFVQIASDRGIEETLADLPSSDIQSYLDEEFRDQLAEEQEIFLSNICALSELRPDTTAILADIEPSRSRRLLSALYDQAVLERLGYYEGQPVYQPHDLFLDHLRDFVGLERLNEQHRRAAVFYAQRLEKANLIGQQDDMERYILSGEWFQSYGKHMAEITAAGQMFDYHVRQIESDETLLERIINLLENADVDSQAVITPLSMYYNQYGDENVWEQFYDEIGIDQYFSRFGEELEAIDDIAEPQRSFLEIVADASRMVPLTQAGMPEKIASILEKDRGKMRDLVSEPEVDEVAGLGFVILSAFLESTYDDLGNEEQAEVVNEEMNAFVREQWGLDTEDLGNVLRIMVQSLGDHLDREEPVEELDDPREALNRWANEYIGEHEALDEVGDDVDMTEEISQQGTYGGTKATFEKATELVDDAVSQIDVDATDIFPVVDDLSVEIASYFDEEGHPALAAATRDLNTVVRVIYLPLLTSNYDEPPLDGGDGEGVFESEFADTRFARQAKELMEALEKVNEKMAGDDGSSTNE